MISDHITGMIQLPYLLCTLTTREVLHAAFCKSLKISLTEKSLPMYLS